jgi:hypothetical protein
MREEFAGMTPAGDAQKALLTVMIVPFIALQYQILRNQQAPEMMRWGAVGRPTQSKVNAKQ